MLIEISSYCIVNTNNITYLSDYTSTSGIKYTKIHLINKEEINVKLSMTQVKELCNKGE